VRQVVRLVRLFYVHFSSERSESRLSLDVRLLRPDLYVKFLNKWCSILLRLLYVQVVQVGIGIEPAICTVSGIIMARIHSIVRVDVMLQ
jgi:hypothetical protein